MNAKELAETLREIFQEFPAYVERPGPAAIASALIQAEAIDRQTSALRAQVTALEKIAMEMRRWG